LFHFYVNPNLQSLEALLEIVLNAAAVAELCQRLSTWLALQKATFFFWAGSTWWCKVSQAEVESFLPDKIHKKL
jgi:hypothetical protein